MVRGTLKEIRGILGEVRRTLGEVWGTLREVRGDFEEICDGSGDPRGGPEGSGVHQRRPGWVRRPSGRSGTGKDYSVDPR